MSTLSKTGWVYELIDPRNGQCRYVGCTMNFENRKKRHITWAFQSRKLDAWKQELCDDGGLDPEVQIIESGIPRSVLRERELHWVRDRVSGGFQLLNMPSGRIKKEDLFQPSDAMICMEHADEILGVIDEILKRCENRIPTKAFNHLWKAQQSVLSLKHSLSGTT